MNAAADTWDVLVIGAGPAGVAAALRAGDLGARTALIARGALGGMAANDGPVPVRTLSHAARLLRDARQLERYGISAGPLALDYPRLLERVKAVTAEVGERSAFRRQLEAAGVALFENAGTARLLDATSVATDRGGRFQARRLVLCTGGVARGLPVPGAEFTASHSDAWALTRVPASMLVIGAGATGMQVASVFAAFGTRVQLFQREARILVSEDEEVSALMADAFRGAGIGVHEGFGEVERFERSGQAVRMTWTRDGARHQAEAELAVVAVGWRADTAALQLPAVGVETDRRGFVRVDRCQRTSCPSIFAAGDVTGQMMLVPQALQAGFVAGTNAVRDGAAASMDAVGPIGSFTDPEYARVGLTEAEARRAGLDVLAVRVDCAEATRAIIDGRTRGFCKLVIDRARAEPIGCHVVGERAVDICQTAALAIAARMSVHALSRIPLSFPTYAGILALAAARAARSLSRGSGDAGGWADPSSAGPEALH
jgi:dihydrolipoamide dehydrogenase